MPPSPAVPPSSKRLVRWKRHLRGTPRARRLARAVGSGTLLLALGLAPFAPLRLVSTAQATPLPPAVAARQAPALFARTSNFPASIQLGALNGSDGTRLDGAAANDRAGSAVSEAGDVNGDGFDDLIVSAPYADANGSDFGAAYVLFGDEGGFAADLDLTTLTGSTGFRLTGAAAIDQAGKAVSGAGDVNGDGFDDLLIGAHYADPNGSSSGAAYVVFGGASVGSSGAIALGSLDGSTGFRLTGVAAGDQAGRAVSGAGDVNGDGFADLLIGAPYADPNGSSSGTAYLIFGGASVGNTGTVALGTLNGSDGFRLNGAAAGDYAGYSVSGASDVNGDGFDDLLIGAFGADPNGSLSGAAYVVFGGASVGSGGPIALGSLNGSDGFRLTGVAAGDFAGRAVSGAGDVNGDGFDDLIVGAPLADPNGGNSGAAYLVFGGASVGSSGAIALGTLNGNNGFRLTGKAAIDQAGKAVSGAGDVNGDSFADLIIGAPGVDPGPFFGVYDSGSAYVVFGGASVGSGGTVALGSLNGNNGFILKSPANAASAGQAVSGAGDVDGDGVADLLVGAPGLDQNGQRFSGSAYLVFGRGDTVEVALGELTGPDGFALNGAAANDLAGDAVSNAGDVNGDGFGDLLIGAPYADPHGDYSGAAYVVFGGAGGFAGSLNLGSLTGSAGFVMNGAAEYDYAGDAVSGAGDVNGDGFDDLLIGAYGADADRNQLRRGLRGVWRGGRGQRRHH